MERPNATTDSSYKHFHTDEVTQGYDKLMKQHFEYKLSVDLYIYVIPVLAILGCTCNFLSFLVTRRSRMKQLPICVIISVLAFADSGVLVFSAVRYWIGKISGYDLKMLSNVTCKMFGGFVYHFVRHYASWLVVLIAATRTVVVFLPLKSATFATVRVTKISCLIVGVILVCIDSSLFWMYELIQDPIEIDGSVVYQKRCFIRGSLRFIWPWIDLLLYSLLPMILLTAFSIALSIKAIIILRSRRKLFSLPALPSIETLTSRQSVSTRYESSTRSELTPPNTAELNLAPTSRQNVSTHHESSTRSELTPPNSVELNLAVGRSNLLKCPDRRVFPLGQRSARVAPLKQEVSEDTSGAQKTGEKRQPTSDWRHSIIPIIISVFFIFTTGGITGMEIVYSDITDRDPKSMARIRLARTCLFLLMYCNHSLNFVLYLLCGKNFRVETLALFRWRLQ